MDLNEGLDISRCGSTQQRITPTIVHRRKREKSLAACESCRQKRAKCDGVRPTCQRCHDLNSPCAYSVHEGETRISSLMKKYGAMEQETSQLKELYTFMRDKPLQEAYEIFTYIRSSADPLEALRRAKTIKVLNLYPVNESGELDPGLKKLDLEALEQSPIKVHARPWTNIARSVHRDAFLKDMAMGIPEKAKYCSPLLVNIICALQCFISQRAKVMGIFTRQNMTERFFEEAKILYDRESGRATVPTAQALYLMFLTLNLLGRDRAGLVFRYMCFEVIKQLKLERKFNSLQGDSLEEALERSNISKFLWGLFLVESRVCFFYGQTSLAPHPSIPQIFEQEHINATEIDQNIDIYGKPFNGSSPQPPFTPGILHAGTNLTTLENEAVIHSITSPIKPGSDVDIEIRKSFYARWKILCNNTPISLNCDYNFTPQTCDFRLHQCEIVVYILQSLPLNSTFLGNDRLLREVYIEQCRQAVEISERHIRFWRVGVLPGRAMFSTLAPLISELHDTTIHDIFIRGCCIIDICTKSYPVFKLLLQAIQAIANAMKQKIPGAARMYFKNLVQPSELDDLPTGFKLPERKEIQDMINQDSDDQSHFGAELSVLISKWTAFTVN